MADFVFNPTDQNLSLLWDKDSQFLTDTYKIIGFCGDHLLIERLKEMGIHQGLQIQSCGRSPFGGPFLFRFGATVVALRKEEAQCIRI